MRIAFAGAVLTALALSACAGGAVASGSSAGPSSPADTPADTATGSDRSGTAPASADLAGASPSPSGQWGPTPAELAAARQQVAVWTPQQLAGQVIVGRFHGTDAKSAARLVGELHLAGISLTGSNIEDAAQVRALTKAVTATVAEDRPGTAPVLSVDQEGGPVAHLRGVSTPLPSFMAAGAAMAGALAGDDPAAGDEAVGGLAEATALELRSLGFTWIFAPVADVTIGPKDPIIRDRSASSDPKVAAATVTAAVRGFASGAIVPVVKHFPGHGSVTEDSHKALPVQSATLAELTARDLVPFDAAVAAGTPAVMMSHLAVKAVDPGVPISLSAKGYALLRHRGFTGVAITDSLGMGAVKRGGDPVVRAIANGADLALMPADTRVSHAALVKAVQNGTVPRDRIQDAAAKVLALQAHQYRQQSQVAVPGDAAARAGKAEAALSTAAVTLVRGSCPAEPLASVRVVSGSSADRRAFAAAAKRQGLRTGSGPSLALAGSSGGRADIVAATGTAWTLPRSSGERVYALYSDTPGAFDGLAAALRTGTAPGRLPVSVAGVTPPSC